MQHALKRLRALQQELESLHRTTASVLAESERLIGALEGPAAIAHVPKSRAGSAPKPKRAPSSTTRPARRLR